MTLSIQIFSILISCLDRYFYGGLLHSGGQTRDTVVAPYTVMHMPGVATTEGGNTSNKEEVGVVIKIIEVLRKMVGHIPSIGVITFYAKPKQVISLEVQTKKLGNIVVNTVDGIQGSERDIIIISCVREGSGEIEFLQDRQRLNVALTRAKYSLVVVGNMNTLQVEIFRYFTFLTFCPVEFWPAVEGTDSQCKREKGIS